MGNAIGGTVGSLLGDVSMPTEPIWATEFIEALPSQEGKVCVITGTTTGLGKEAARVFGEKGGTVLMLNRPSERAMKAVDYVPNSRHIDCDLGSLESVKRAAEDVKSILGEKGAIDVLALNAGIMARKEMASEDGYDIQMQTNVMSQFALTEMLLQYLKRSQDCRVVSHSSVARCFTNTRLEREYFGKSPVGLPPTWRKTEDECAWDRYNQSKLANCAFGRAFHKRIYARRLRIKSVVCHPGLAASELWSTDKIKVSDVATKFFLKLKLFQSQLDGAMPLMHCMMAKPQKVKAGHTYSPDHRFGCKGPVKDWGIDEKYGNDRNCLLLWQECEKFYDRFHVK